MKEIEIGHSPSEDILNENSKLETKVVLALSRLQKGQKYLDGQGKFAGIGCKQLVEYLCANYRNLDGDVETQVITALLSCVKSGIICALDNGKYRLLAPNSKIMTSNCQSRFSHGPKCSCINMINCLSKAVLNTCCYIKGTGKSKGGKKVIRRKSQPLQKSRTKRKSTRTKESKGKSPGKSSQRSASKKTSKSSTKCVERSPSERTDGSTCNYCLEIHPPPGGDKKEKKSCQGINPPNTRYGVPFDKFSPREESMAFYSH